MTNEEITFTYQAKNPFNIKNTLMLSLTTSFTITSKEGGNREWIFL
ncbi:hypothetical protein [Lysinibacillus sphaericus]|nr:hypothetical protein [Lysinibacillus sphaericus]